MRSRIVAALLAALVGSLAPLALAGAEPEPIERILAVVDGTPVLLSEVKTIERLRGLERSAAVEALIDEKLMLKDAARLPEALVGQDEAEKAAADLAARLQPEVAAALGPRDLLRVARRQAAILKYVGFRFQPQVRVEDADVKRAYESEFAGKDGAPSYEAALPEITSRLQRKALDQRIEAWVKDLRSAADIRSQC